MANETVRAFYAINLDDATRAATQQVMEKLQSMEWSGFVRWTPANNLHITLRFLGDVTTEHLTQINKRLAPRLAEFPAFSIAFKEPRLFPHFRKPKVVAILIPHNELLIQLADAIENCVLSTGLESQSRQFKAHLTLGRCNKSFPKRIKIDPMPMSSKLAVNNVTLYQSILSESGPTYIRLENLPLKSE